MGVGRSWKKAKIYDALPKIECNTSCGIATFRLWRSLYHTYQNMNLPLTVKQLWMHVCNDGTSKVLVLGSRYLLHSGCRTNCHNNPENLRSMSYRGTLARQQSTDPGCLLLCMANVKATPTILLLEAAPGLGKFYWRKIEMLKKVCVRPANRTAR